MTVINASTAFHIAAHKTPMNVEQIDDLIARRLYWQLPIIAKRAREAAEKIKHDAHVNSEDLRRPMTI